MTCQSILGTYLQSKSMYTKRKLLNLIYCIMTHRHINMLARFPDKRTNKNVVYVNSKDAFS